MGTPPGAARRLAALVGTALILSAGGLAAWAIGGISRRIATRAHRRRAAVRRWWEVYRADVFSLVAIGVGTGIILALSIAATTPFGTVGMILGGIVGPWVLLPQIVWISSDAGQRDRWAPWAWSRASLSAQSFARSRWFHRAQTLTAERRFAWYLFLLNLACEVAAPNSALTSAFDGPGVPSLMISGLIVVSYPVWNALLLMTAATFFAIVRSAYVEGVLRIFDRTPGWRWWIRQVPVPSLTLPPGIAASLGYGLGIAVGGLIVLRHAPSWMGTAWFAGFVLLLVAWGVWANVRCFAAGATLGPLVFPAMAVGAWALANLGHGSLSSINPITWANLGINSLSALIATTVAIVQAVAARPGGAGVAPTPGPWAGPGHSVVPPYPLPAQPRGYPNDDVAFG